MEINKKYSSLDIYIIKPGIKNLDPSLSDLNQMNISLAIVPTGYMRITM